MKEPIKIKYRIDERDGEGIRSWNWYDGHLLDFGVSSEVTGYGEVMTYSIAIVRDKDGAVSEFYLKHIKIPNL